MAKRRTERKQNLTEKQELEEIQAFVAICVAVLEDMTLPEMAEATRLCVTTCWRLRNEGAGLATHISTVTRLGRAAGMKLDWETLRPSLRRRAS